MYPHKSTLDISPHTYLHLSRASRLPTIATVLVDYLLHNMHTHPKIRPSPVHNTYAPRPTTPAGMFAHSTAQPQA